MLRERLFKLFNSVKTLGKSPKFIFMALIISIFVLTSSFSIQQNSKKNVKGANTQEKIEINITISRAPSPQVHQSSMKIFGEVTEKKLAPTATPVPKEVSQNSTSAVSNSISINTTDSAGLLVSINSFRTGNGGIAPLSFSGTLCDVAGKRLNELITTGTLDNHAGFNKYFAGQKEFSGMGEVLFQSSNPTSPDYAVNEGWAKSKDGHRENMLNPSWNYGCGATNGHIAVFNFGKK
ncbi:MAG: CAP domain-containing protein [Patescibacteria group bacterium]